MERYRARVVELLPVCSRERREQLLYEAEYNLYRIDGDAVTIDLLTDSGLCALSAEQSAAMMRGDESYAGSASYRRFESAVQEIFGFPHVLPTHQGRASERLLMFCLLRAGDVVPGNMHFDTTRANVRAFGALPVDFPVEEFWKFENPSLFKGNMNVAGLASWLSRADRPRVSFILLTITNNVCGDQAVSLANLQAVHEVAREHRIPLYLDACRFAQNAWFIQRDEVCCRTMSIPEIARRMFALVDGCIFSAKKDGLAHAGGFFATKSDSVAALARQHLLLTEGYTTYGGITGRDMEAIAVGLREALGQSYLDDRMGATQYLFDRLAEQRVPLLHPAGGHAVYLDAARMLPHLGPDEHPAQAFLAELYVESGIRGTRITVSEQVCRRNKTELVRLALPARVYSRAHLDYVAEAVGRVLCRSSKIPGMRLLECPEFLGGFLARYCPNIDRPSL